MRKITIFYYIIKRKKHTVTTITYKEAKITSVKVDQSLKTNSSYKIPDFKYSVHTSWGGGNLSGP